LLTGVEIGGWTEMKRVTGEKRYRPPTGAVKPDFRFAHLNNTGNAT
jgi:hypothetical protein